MYSVAVFLAAVAAALAVLELDLRRGWPVLGLWLLAAIGAVGLVALWAAR